MKVDVEIIDPEDAELGGIDDEFALTDEEIAELSDEDLDFLLQLDGDDIRCREANYRAIKKHSHRRLNA